MEDLILRAVKSQNDFRCRYGPDWKGSARSGLVRPGRVKGASASLF